MYPDFKRYYTLNNFYRHKFGCKISKINLNANFSCPNFEKNNQGCIFCNGDFANDKTKSLEEQFYEAKKQIDKKWPNSKHIVYFQAGTNTYAPLKKLQEVYEQALSFENVVGISIATRADAISKEVLDYLDELNHRTFLTIELGLQTMHDKTLKFINRGHDLKCFEQMVQKLQERNINIVVHIINGLPYESKQEMLETVKYLNWLKIDGIKFHMLYISQNTYIAKLYNEGKIRLLTKDEYIAIVCQQLKYLNPNIVIHRLSSDPLKCELIAPLWLEKKFCILNDIDKLLKKENIYQGICT